MALGGRPGVGTIVDSLYNRLEHDPDLTRLFRSPRAGERERLKLFFESIFGGESSGIRDVGMQRRHLHRLISAAESERWLAHFVAALADAGAAEHGRAAWQKASGYTIRARAEAAIGRFKQVIGGGLRSRTDQRRATEGDVAVHTLNRMLELGCRISVRIA